MLRQTLNFCFNLVLRIITCKKTTFDDLEVGYFDLHFLKIKDCRIVNNSLCWNPGPNFYFWTVIEVIIELVIILMLDVNELIIIFVLFRRGLISVCLGLICSFCILGLLQLGYMRLLELVNNLGQIFECPIVDVHSVDYTSKLLSYAIYGRDYLCWTP